MKNKIKIMTFALCALAFTSCEDFLDRPPYDQFDETEFWESEAQARAFMYSTYPIIFPGYDSGTVDPSTFYFETGNDDYMSKGTQTELYGSPGNDAIPTSDGSWSFTNIRRANYIIENVHRLPLDETSINHWQGVGRFFRAYFYSNMVFTYGDVPYMDHFPVLSDRKEDMDYLYKNRDPRTFVVGKIMEDFRYAMDNCRANDGGL
ncbi:MAG: RagB/SusD family nutrient uptake outer membrane protein, partial [Prevotella sp.]|nr:RagB/SusD family nutrient uptake outer membrane protein [Prevotella sp.]